MAKQGADYFLAAHDDTEFTLPASMGAGHNRLWSDALVDTLATNPMKARTISVLCTLDMDRTIEVQDLMATAAVLSSNPLKRSMCLMCSPTLAWRRQQTVETCKPSHIQWSTSNPTEISLGL
eukprot:scaffold265869_cov40-Prasinocladus_malaysianus.AAC.1